MLKDLTFINMVGFPVSEYVGDSKKGLLFYIVRERWQQVWFKMWISKPG